MKAAQLREQTVEELAQALEDAQKAVSDLRVKQGMGDSSEQPLLIRQKRRELARIMTVMNEKNSQNSEGVNTDG